MTTTQDFSHLRALAKAALPGPHHIYTNARDSNNWEDNEKWHVACEPQTVIAMLDALEALQAEALALKAGLRTCVGVKDQALARLAAIENQEPAYLLTPDGKCYAYGSAQPLSAGHADATLLKLYAAAGASPVEPSQALELELSDAEIKKISSDLSLYEDYQPESCQADYLDPVKFARAIIAAMRMTKTDSPT